MIIQTRKKFLFSLPVMVVTVFYYLIASFLEIVFRHRTIFQLKNFSPIVSYTILQT